MKSLSLIFVLIISINLHSAIADHPEGTVKVDIYGLVCDFCAQALEKVFGKETAVDDIEVDLEAKIVTIHLKNGMQLEDALIEKNILDAGYNVEAIRRGG
jgi:copper chaperone CopZ